MGDVNPVEIDGIRDAGALEVNYPMRIVEDKGRGRQ